MGRKFPPFASVTAFEAAARHQSFKLAADELCVTPSAISHRIRTLEEYLDTALFERTGTGVRLTLTGQTYSGKLSGLLDGIDGATREAKETGDQPFRVLMTPGFAARWLVPRLPNLPFWRDVRLRVSSGAPSTDFATNDADFVIQWSDTQTPGVRTERLMTSLRYPIASPELVARERLSQPRDLHRVQLIYDETDDAWDEWFSAAGVPPPKRSGPIHPNCELATTAVEQGQGVSLAYDAMIRGTLASGRVIRLFDTVTSPMVIYSAAYPEARGNEPRIADFRDWLFGEVSAAFGRAAAE